MIAYDEEIFTYEDGGEQLAEYAERFGLLYDRLRLIREHMPDATAVVPVRVRRERRERAGGELDALELRIRDLDQRIASRTARALQLGLPLPLELLRDRFELAQVDVEIASMLFALECGTAFNPYDTRHVTANEHVGNPDVAFLMALLAGGDPKEAERVRERFLPESPLLEAGIVSYMGGSADSPLIYKRVRLSERALGFLSGQMAPPSSVLGTAASFTEQPPGADAYLLEDPTLIGRVARASSPDQLVILRGAPGVGRKSIAGAAARELRRPLLVVDLSRVSLDPNELAQTLATWFREARMQHAMLVLDRADEFADREGQAGLWPVLLERIARSELLITLVCSNRPPWLARIKRVLCELSVPFPSEETQHRLWVRHLPPTLTLTGLSLDEIVRTYSLSCEAIIATADELGRMDQVHGRGGVVDHEIVVEIVRKRLAHQLGALADVVRTTMEWKDVVLSDEIYDRVIEFLNFARHRQAVMRDMGFGRKLAYGRGLSALFSGPPGTGKTMICTLLAKELGMELYRIDLSQVVNKYIGETEKNLGRVFDEASRGQVMLLFDEADSIFAKRTEVKSSHDRYANLEVNYLLQRMEGHEGIVVLTTNSETSIDRAFLRRIRFRVRFPAPADADRERLWRGMVPKEVKLAPDVDFRALAERFPMAGGNIMNALVRAAISAAASGQPVGQTHLIWAAELEYSEMGFLA
jgi:SpoVK/Ycf46/Vps4 family AAA+-type ATPase